MTLRTLLEGPIAKGTLISLMIRVGSIALGIAQAVLTARLLGPEGYGAVAYVISLSILLSTIVMFGTEPLAIREVARLKAMNDMAGLNGFLFTIRWMVLVAALLGACAVALIIPEISHANSEFEAVLFYTVLIFPLFAFILQSQGILRGFGNVVMAQVPFQVVRQIVLVGFLATVWTVGFDVGPKGYLNTVLVGAVIALVVIIISIRRTDRGTDTLRKTPSFGRISSQAAPFFAVSVLGLLLAEISTLMLAWWTDPEQTGLFQPIARIAPLIMLGAQAASMRYAPRVSEFWTNGEVDRLKDVTQIFTITTTGFALACGIAVLVLDDFILGLFGDAFVEMTTALWWVVAAQVFSSACGPVGLLLTMTNRTALAIWPQVIALIACLVTGYVLIPEHGAAGAAIAMSAGTLSWSLAMLISVKRNLGIDPSLFGYLSRAKSAR